MSMRRSLIVKLTKNQHERLKNNAEAKGYKTISSYIRAVTLEHDLSFEEKFDELYNTLVNGNQEKKKREKNTELKEFIKL